MTSHKNKIFRLPPHLCHKIFKNDHSLNTGCSINDKILIQVVYGMSLCLAIQDFFPLKKIAMIIKSLLI